MSANGSTCLSGMTVTTAVVAAAGAVAVGALVMRHWERARLARKSGGVTHPAPTGACAKCKTGAEPPQQPLPVREPPNLQPQTVVFDAERLRAFCENVFKHFGVPDDDAALAADVLSSADRRGIDSHGVARLHTYVNLLRAGRVNPRPNVRVVHETPGTATVDGDNGLGLVVGVKANRIAIAKAQKVGSGWVAVRNSNHFSTNSYYCLEAVAQDMIGLAMTNTTALVAPIGAAERMLGTNPLAAAFPAGEEPPVVIDFASSVVSFGKIEIAMRQGVKLPFGWAVDKHGKPTQDPSAAMEGALLPLGSDLAHGGHKGYGLSCLVDLLSGVVPGASWGPNVPPFSLQGLLASTAPVTAGRGTGHFFGAWRIDAFRPKEEFKADMDAWIRRFHAAKPEAGKRVLVPGDPEHMETAKRRKQGIPVSVKVVEDMDAIVKQTGIEY